MRFLTGLEMLNIDRKTKYLCFYGVGVVMQDRLEGLINLVGRADYLCDSSSQKQGNIYNDIRCISLQQLGGLDGDVTVIITVRNYENIYKPLKVKEINPEYKLYLRHNTYHLCDTDLYAIM